MSKTFYLEILMIPVPLLECLKLFTQLVWYKFNRLFKFFELTRLRKVCDILHSLK